VREIAAQVIGAKAENAQVIVPSQGINNRTYIVQPVVGAGVVIKLRPRPDPRVRNSPQWPRYCQNLFGPVPNGDIATLGPLTETLDRHGRIKVPRLHLVDSAQALVCVPYVISERLPSISFGWDNNPFHSAPARQLGEHLACVHQGTARAAGFGIYAGEGGFPLEDWWRRFQKAYETILGDLTRTSFHIRAVRERLERALAQAVAAGKPSSCALICVDQNPTHYLGLPNGRITGLIDVEAHLWAPPEYELAMVELWMPDKAAFRAAYEEHLSWPGVLDAVRPAYWFFTWMEWIYCVHTLLHDPQKAAGMEEKLGALCREVMQ
jgi:fructosamine-3-kinase